MSFDMLEFSIIAFIFSLLIISSTSAIFIKPNLDNFVPSINAPKNISSLVEGFNCSCSEVGYKYKKYKIHSTEESEATTFGVLLQPQFICELENKNPNFFLNFSISEVRNGGAK